MLETIVKRSGVEEAFSNSKTNGWVSNVGKDILHRMDWSSIVISAHASAPEKMTSQEWQMHLINTLKARGSRDDGHPYLLMAGRLYSIYLMKKIHGDSYPTIKELQTKLIALNYMRDMGYSDSEYEFLERHIQHERNIEMTWAQVEQYNVRYSLRDYTTYQTYETPQFTMMRMAMAVHEKDSPDVRVNNVLEKYRDLADDIINPPSPNYAALGTRHYGMASCCLIAAKDTAQSVKAAGNIAYDFTLASGGLGIHLDLRSLGDPVDGGRVMHAGRMNYITKLVGDTCANKQGARGGAVTFYDTVYSPELELNIMMQNTRTPVEFRERRLNVAYQTNSFFTRKAAKKEQYFTFNSFTAPDLYDAFFDADQTRFEELYAKYEADPDFKKNYRSAWDTLAWIIAQEIEQSTLFWNDPEAMNKHTPFKGRIIQSNLCLEVMVVSKPWDNMIDLYDPKGDPEKGEVGICNIGSIPIHNLPFDPKDPKKGLTRYKRAVRSMMEIVDYAIDNSEYHYPAIATQAKSRRNCSIGMSGVATLFAQLDVKMTSPEGRAIWHSLCERHAYACAEVALELGIERGNAPWINGPNNDGVNGTKWVDGWTYLDTYKKTIDTVVDPTIHFDWEDLSNRIVANKGIRFSTLVAHMPGEQSTRKGTGSNSILFVQGLSLDLGDKTNALPWCVWDSDLIGHRYELAFDVTDEDIAIHYGIAQKWCDQGISGDSYERRDSSQPLTERKLIQRHVNRVKFGWKSAYYTRSFTEQGGDQVIERKETTLPTEVKTEVKSTVGGDALARAIARAQEMQSQEGASCTIDGNCGA